MKIIDPAKAAHYEVSWWQAHHRGDKLRLAYYLFRQQQECFQLSWWQTTRLVYYLVRAARGHDSRDWQLAEEYMIKSYDYLKRLKGLQYKPEVVARLEIASWKLHDNLENEKNKNELIDVIALLWSYFFNLPKSEMLGLARDRVNAFSAHDLAEKRDISAERSQEYWHEAEANLQKFYKKIVNVIEKLN